MSFKLEANTLPVCDGYYVAVPKSQLLAACDAITQTQTVRYLGIVAFREDLCATPSRQIVMQIDVLHELNFAIREGLAGRHESCAEVFQNFQEKGIVSAHYQEELQDALWFRSTFKSELLQCINDTMGKGARAQQVKILGDEAVTKYLDEPIRMLERTLNILRPSSKPPTNEL